MAWYTPTTNPKHCGDPLPDRKGRQIGPFILIKLHLDVWGNPCNPHWQLDHWPTGFALKRQVSYRQALAWARRHADDPFWRFTKPPERETAHWQHLKRQFDELT